MSDKKRKTREYERVNISAPCTIYLSNGEEYSGTVYNISENGIGVGLDFNKNITDETFLGMPQVGFALVNAYMLLKRENRRIVTGVATVVRFEKTEDGCYFIGMLVSAPDQMYNEYIKDRHLFSYVKSTSLPGSYMYSSTYDISEEDL